MENLWFLLQYNISFGGTRIVHYEPYIADVSLRKSFFQITFWWYFPAFALNCSWDCMLPNKVPMKRSFKKSSLRIRHTFLIFLKKIRLIRRHGSSLCSSNTVWCGVGCVWIVFTVLCWYANAFRPWLQWVTVISIEILMIILESPNFEISLGFLENLYIVYFL